MSPIAVVLAGGASRRMGTDKAALIWQGRSLLAHTTALCRAVGLGVVVAGRDRPDQWPDAEVAFLSDNQPGLGPLSGLANAMTCTQPRAAIALACDLPLLSVDALRWLVQAGSSADPNRDGLIVADTHGHLQPLFSLYFASAVTKMHDALKKCRRSMMGLIDSGDFAIISAPDWIEAQLVNVNTPEDLARLCGG